MNDRITALEEALQSGIDLIKGDTTGSEWKKGCRDFIASARAALAASRAAPDCHQPDLVTAAQVRVKPLEWEDFDGMGAKASAFYDANYLITMWRGRGQFEVALSYPGYQTGYDGERFHDTIEAAKAAAQADYEARILAALDLTPAVEPVAMTAQDAARVPEIAALIEAADHLLQNYLRDELDEPDLCVDDDHWSAIHEVNAALRAIGGDA